MVEDLDHSRTNNYASMPLAIPAELKKIAPYIKRAEELDKDQTSPESRLVAYYLRQYAVHLGIPLAGVSPGSKTCLGHLLGDLEKEKPAMDNFSRDEAAFLCRKFAEGVFNKADNEDRAGLAGKGTAKTFYAAQSFLQMLEQFAQEGDESDQAAEDKKRIVYSKWKATEILKAIKDGRAPIAGGYDEDVMEEEEFPAVGGTANYDDAAGEKPAMETVSDDCDDFGIPVAPKTLPPLMKPVSPPKPDEMDEENDDENSEVEEGTEVELGPPPAFPDGTFTEPAPSARLDRPTLSFDVPPVEQPSLKAKTSMFGFKKKTSAKQASKLQLSDALELTKFALAALEDKDGELAAERLQQALSALGR